MPLFWLPKREDLSPCGSITTTGEGANGAFAVGSGSEVALSDLNIRATAGGGHGVMVVGGGTITLTRVNIYTQGEHGAALVTDRGGGAATAIGGVIQTAGQGSPALYSTGVVTARGVKMLVTGSEGAVIEGSNSILIQNSELEARKLCAAMLYQSFSGDAQGRESHLTIEGGSLTVAEGPAFYVTNTHGILSLTGVNIHTASGILVKAASGGRWGRSGQNGGEALLLADRQRLHGYLLVADSTSSIKATLKKDSSLHGRSQGASLDLDASSVWEVTADSAVAGLTEAAGMNGLANIHSNGHVVTYRSADASNGWLGGKSYPLSGGGTLKPTADAQ